MEQSSVYGAPAVARWRTLPLERKLHWILRLGVVGCFIGHGAYGFITKEAWVPYFGVVGINRAWAYKLMPWVGAMDVSLGLTAAIIPLPIVLLHMTVWGIWTAALRPLSGDSVWELVERAGNYGVPLAFLILVGVPRRLRGWFTPSVAVHHAATHRQRGAGDTRDPAPHDLPAAARSWRTRRAQQQAGADRTLWVYWPR